MITTQRAATRRATSLSLALLLALAAGSALGQQEVDDTAEVDAAQVDMAAARVTERDTYCGEKLVDTINFVCAFYGGSYSPSSQKRNKAQSPFRSWFNKRQQQGIVQRCCYRACTLDTLRSYCTFPMPPNGTTLSQEVTSTTTTRRPTTTTTTAAPTTTTTSPASPQGTIIQLTTASHDRIPILNDDDYFPVLYYRLNRALQSRQY